MFTPTFIKHYPTPWRTGDASSPEVVDCHGDHVIAFEADEPEDREFWENVVAAVNAASPSATVHPFAAFPGGINPGLYTVFWKSGGSSLAAVGMQANGTRWLAPTNWLSPAMLPSPGAWGDIDRVEPVVPMDLSGTPDPVADFLAAVADEIERAAMLHPGPNPNLAALTEEVGEIAEALLEARQSLLRFGAVMPGDWEAIRMEAVQVAAMAFRIVFEGDPTLSVVPE